MSKNGPAPTEGEHTLVRFFDGREALSPARVGDLVAFELEFDRAPNTARVSDVLWMVWRSFGQPDTFQAWADTVAELVNDEDAIAAARERLPDPPEAVAAGGS